tara:strand:+ start:334 stop:546 length:213 start_codon:yes stop_codon:yes gene_type:complete
MFGQERELVISELWCDSCFHGHLWLANLAGQVIISDIQGRGSDTVVVGVSAVLSMVSCSGAGNVELLGSG